MWTWIRRRLLTKSVEGFVAAPDSYVNQHVHFEGFNRLYPHTIVVNASLGLFTYVADRARVANCRIGRYCSIGPETLIGGLGRHPSRWLSSHPIFFSTKKQTGSITFADRDYFDELPQLIVGNDVWLGARAVVLDGLNVGDGAIIGAGAVVVRDVEPYSVVGGVPAKTIRMRYDDKTVSNLLEIKWWDWPTDRLRELAHLFRTDDVTTVARLTELQKSSIGKP